MKNWHHLFRISEEEYNSLDRECMNIIEKGIEQAWIASCNYVPLYTLWHSSHGTKKWSTLVEILEFLDGNGISYYDDSKDVAKFTFNLDDVTRAVADWSFDTAEAFEAVKTSAEKMSKALIDWSDSTKKILNTNKMFNYDSNYNYKFPRPEDICKVRREK